MRYTFPDYYREFSCTADRCEDTCCAGWQIVADRKALRRYLVSNRRKAKAHHIARMHTKCAERDLKKMPQTY